MKFVINGDKKLGGSIAVNGSKNAALKLLSGALLSRGPVRLNNIPDVADVRNMIELMRDLGSHVSYENHTCTIKPSQLVTSELNTEIAKRLRASIMLVPPVLLQKGEVSFPHPGGCVIGERPIDLFLDGYRSFGATVVHTQKTYTVMGNNLHSARFVFPVISVQGTESLMMLASKVPGTSTLINAACEPDIVTLANFLNSCGAQIMGAGTPTIQIEGSANWPEKEAVFSNMPDRIEAGSFIILGIAASADLEITNVEPSHLEVPLAYLRAMGANLIVGTDTIRVMPNGSFSPAHIKTHEYPGFPTDLQSPMVVLMTQATGQSIIHETIFEGRLAWTEELKRMGANILNVDNFRVAVTGPTPLRGRTAESLDIRAGMAYLIAGLIAQGTSVVNGIEKIDRGYERIEERLKTLGADIQRVS